LWRGNQWLFLGQDRDEKENSMSINEQAVDHLNQIFAEARAAVESFPDDLWQREGEDDVLRVPAFLAHHTIWCMSLGHLLNIPGDRIRSRVRPPYRRENMLTREEVLGVLDDIKAYANEVYGSMPDAEYLDQGDKPRVPFDAVMYTIAHTRHHLGQLVQLLKENGHQPPPWYPLR
jgi:hypothetical protein